MKKQMEKDDIQKELATVLHEDWLKFFEAASVKYSIELAVLLGIASRETNCVPDLAYCRKFGDGGHGRGIIQIDDRWHKKFLAKHNGKPQPEACIDYGAALLRANLDYFKGDYIKALCAYNAGIGGVNRALAEGKTPDQATTGGDYGSDVLRRANLFKQLLAEGK